MKQFMSRKKAMLCSIFNHKHSPSKIRMSAYKTTFVYAIKTTPKMIVIYRNLPKESLTVLSHLQLCMITSSPSGTTGLFFGKNNLHEMHDSARSHSGLFKKRISNFLLLWQYSVNSFLFERSILESSCWFGLILYSGNWIHTDIDFATSCFSCFG